MNTVEKAIINKVQEVLILSERAEACEGIRHERLWIYERAERDATPVMQLVLDYISILESLDQAGTNTYSVMVRCMIQVSKVINRAEDQIQELAR